MLTPAPFDRTRRCLAEDWGAIPWVWMLTMEPQLQMTGPLQPQGGCMGGQSLGTRW